MSKYEQCPKCQKKGWHTVYGYDPNPEKGPMKRCKYCQHAIRIRDLHNKRNKPMEFYTVPEAASKLGLRPDQVNALCSMGFFGRKVGNVWLITDHEIEYYDEREEKVPEDQRPVFYDAAAAINKLGISRSRFYRMVAREEIDVLRFGRRSGNPNIVVTEEQMEAALKQVAGAHGSTTRLVDADQYIEHRGDRYFIRGTYSKDPNGQERNYKTLTSARAKAREAYGQDPIYKKGDQFPAGDHLVVTVMKDVTPIDGLVLLKVGKAQVLWPIGQLIALEDQLTQERG